jgi:UPF0755 protein
MKRLLSLLLVVLLGATAFLGWGAWSAWQWWRTPLPLARDGIEFTVPPGMPLRAVAQGWVKAGVQSDARWLFWAWRATGDAPRVRAGSYAAEPGDTPERLLQKMVRGEELLASVQLLEGWTFAQVRAQLARQPHLKPMIHVLSDAALMEEIGRAGQSPEGRFFPDTYRHSRGASDLSVLLQAMEAMDRRLAEAWAQRAADTPLKSADDLLTLASIVEKETGRDAERPLVAAVFTNRLRIGMRLQTDPTVIFGLGERFDGNLRRIDLLTDTPYNSYTRAGLPPTPIALPGRASLMAAARPSDDAKLLYFVARGDGTSEFSATLDAHNRAVQRFQLGQK